MNVETTAEGEIRGNVTHCVCGKRHRRETKCATAERVQRDRDHADAVLAALRALPVQSVTVHDTRGDLARARTLGDVEALVAQYSDAAELEYADAVVASDGTTLIYAATHGGGVSNSYREAAWSDELRVVTAEGRVLLVLWRGRARSGPHGKVANPNYLVSAAAARAASTNGVSYAVNFVRAAKRANRLHMLLARRARGARLPAVDEVELDRALETGELQTE